ncbi:hypothetical protein F383_29394 [Gossypium arboreum]|uniref:Uncharacterized protein n=1 Tax=Gossypium arboreum TaxID=29729 RepID=A0A0B0PJH1_GOSAR|nr:hypothetical protein F383_29394 [Gossypium arboreum]
MWSQWVCRPKWISCIITKIPLWGRTTDLLLEGKMTILALVRK